MEEKKNINIFEIWENTALPIISKAKRFWYIPLAIFALVFTIAYLNEAKKDPKFSSRITFMLEDDILGENQSTGGGSQILMALSGQQTQSNKAVIVDLSLSNKLVEESLIKSIKIDSQLVVLANYYLDNCGMRKVWKEDNNAELLKLQIPENYVIGTNLNYDFWLRNMSNQIKLSLKSQVMESGLIVMNYSDNQEKFTKVFLETHLKTISEFYINKKVERTLNLVKFAKRKKDSLLAALTGKTYGLANIQDQGFGQVMKRAKVPELQMTRDIGILNQQYNESVAALSGAGIDLERQKPFISVVDDIRLPLDSVWPKPFTKAITFAIISMILAFAVIVGLILGIKLLKEQRMEYNNKIHS